MLCKRHGPFTVQVGRQAVVIDSVEKLFEIGLVRPVDEGTPQGGSLSAILSNLVPDDLDKDRQKVLDEESQPRARAYYTR
jgi:hypothetical protein